MRRFLERYRAGEISTEEALERLNILPYEDLGYAKVDHHRALRKGFPEVVFGLGKTPEQVGGIVASLVERGGPGTTILVTKSEPAAHEAVRGAVPSEEVEFHTASGMIIVNPREENADAGLTVVVCAGTTDIPVAEEAELTARAMGCRVRAIHDVGVAGIHRLLDRAEELRSARVVIAVAGMEGALPSVVGGLVAAPVIAVPTSVGYGASFGGLSALLAMLNSCASGIAVVNIDNGFGAGYFAAQLEKKVAE